MLKLLLKLLVLPPELLKMHAQGYADLASQTWAEHLCTLKNRWALYALSGLCLVLALGLGGVALLVMAALLWAWARRLRTRPFLRDIQTQLELDFLAIQQARAS